MKKQIILLILGITCITSFTYAQKVHGKAKATKDSLTKLTPQQKKDRLDKMKMLNLTEDQQKKVKEISASIRSERKLIEADKTLTPEAKKEKFKALRTKQMDALRQILTPEQMEKFKAFRKDNNTKDKEED